MSDGIAPTISISRSVAVSFSAPLAASSITLDRIGMVLRRSTTLCTWESALRKAPRSTLIFIVSTATDKSFAGREIAPLETYFLVFWSGPRQQKRGAKTQVKDHTKSPPEGQ